MRHGPFPQVLSHIHNKKLKYLTPQVYLFIFLGCVNEPFPLHLAPFSFRNVCVQVFPAGADWFCHCARSWLRLCHISTAMWCQESLSCVPQGIHQHQSCSGRGVVIYSLFHVILRKQNLSAIAEMTAVPIMYHASIILKWYISWFTRLLVRPTHITFPLVIEN